MGRHALAGLVALLLGASLLSGCESVLGVDFGAYKLNACSPLEATCPGTLACLFDTTRKAFACAASTGTAKLDEPCKTESDCTPGFACVAFATNSSSHCTPYCTSAAQCGTGRNCYEFQEPRKVPDGTSVGACGPLDPPCDPLATTSTCASSGARCTIIDTDYTVCIPKEASLGPGSSCTYLSECREGTSCVGSADAGYFCRTLCKVGVGTCPTGTCTSFGTTLKLGEDEIGYCP
jgi:hypothetical protein